MKRTLFNRWLYCLSNTHHPKLTHPKKKMKQEELSELADQELLDKAKKMRSASIINALIIGFMVGIIIYSVVENNVGFLTLIPLFIIYKVFNHSKNYDALKKIVEERGL